MKRLLAIICAILLPVIAVAQEPLWDVPLIPHGSNPASYFMGQSATNTPLAITLGGITRTKWINSKTNACAFAASPSTNVTALAAQYQTVTLDTEHYDYGNCFSANRFTPTTAGIYQFNYNMTMTTPQYFFVKVTKNGDGISLSSIPGASGYANYVTVGSCFAYANGTTDYFDLIMYSTSAYAYYGQAGLAGGTVWSGCLIAGD